MKKSVLFFVTLLLSLVAWADDTIESDVLYQRSQTSDEYDGKHLTITGVATFVGPNLYGLPSVELSKTAATKSQVMCVLPFGKYFDLRKVSKKDNVAVQGRVLLYSPEHDIVVVKECQLLTINGKKR